MGKFYLFFFHVSEHVDYLKAIKVFSLRKKTEKFGRGVPPAQWASTLRVLASEATTLNMHLVLPTLYGFLPTQLTEHITNQFLVKLWPIKKEKIFIAQKLNELELFKNCINLRNCLYKNPWFFLLFGLKLIPLHGIYQ